jgi:DNA-binding response OmpR family regulator
MNKTNDHIKEPLSVLIIDDDESIRVSLQFHFEDCGFKTHSVETAEEALDLMKKTSVDSVIVDLRLPGIDGIEFIKQASKKWLA